MDKFKKKIYEEEAVISETKDILAKKEGIIIGKNLGIEIGREEEKKDITKVMLEMNMKIRDISYITKLTKREILLIKESM